MDKEMNIIIASYGDPKVTPSNLELCLATIKAFTSIPYSIILERSFKSASENRNNGLKRATAPIICFLDDDTWVTPNWHVEPLALIKENENSIVGSIIKLETGKLFNCGIKFKPPLAFIPGEYGQLQKKMSSDIEVAAIPTTAMFSSKKIIGDTLFDIGFTDCQWEDLDFFLKLKAKGGIAVMASSSFVYHEHMFRGKNFDNNYALFKAKWKLKLLVFYSEKFKLYFSSLFEKLISGNVKETDFRLIKKRKSGISIYEQDECAFICKLNIEKNHEIIKEHRVISRLFFENDYVPEIIHEFKKEGLEKDLVLGFVIPYYESDNLYIDNGVIAKALAHVHAENWRVVYPVEGADLSVLIGGHTFWIGGNEILKTNLNLNKTISQEIKNRLFESILKIGAFSSVYTTLFDLTECTIIHGDLTRENIRHSAIKTVFIDWGEASIGPVTNDLMRFFIESHAPLSYRTDFLKIYIAQFKALTGYAFSYETLERQMSYLEPLILLELLVFGQIEENSFWIERITKIENCISKLTTLQSEYTHTNKNNI